MVKTHAILLNVSLNVTIQFANVYIYDVYPLFVVFKTRE